MNLYTRSPGYRRGISTRMAVEFTICANMVIFTDRPSFCVQTILHDILVSSFQSAAALNGRTALSSAGRVLSDVCDNYMEEIQVTLGVSAISPNHAKDQDRVESF